MMNLNKLWSLEFSQYSEDRKMYPWHIGLLKTAIDSNLQDYIYNNRGENKWQIVFIGPTFESCNDALERFIKLKEYSSLKYPHPKKEFIKLERKSKPSNKSGYVYLIKADTGYYKIGRTKDVPRRMNLFTVKLPFDFETIHIIPCIDSIDAERQLHMAFADKRVNGEWFKLDESDVTIIKNIAFADWWREFNRKEPIGKMCGMPEIWQRLPEDYFDKYPYEINHPYTPLPGSGLLPEFEQF